MANPNAKITPEMKAAQWKAGQSGNPGGVSKLFLSKERLRQLLDKYVAMTKEELMELSMAPDTPMVEIIIASALVKAATTGDWSFFEGPLQRHMGKVADEIIMPRPMVIRRPSGETVELTTAQVLEGGTEDE